MWSSNVMRQLSLNHFGHHRIFHPQSQSQSQSLSQSQWLTRRNGVRRRCYSHNSTTNGDGDGDGYGDGDGDGDGDGVPVRYISKQQQSTSSLTHISLQSTSLFPTNTFLHGKTLNTHGPILDGHLKDFTHQHQIKSPLTYKSSHLPEGIINFNQELSCDGLVDEQCMEATDQVFEEDVLSNDTYFKAKPDKTRKAAQKLAVDLLAKRAVTAVQLRKKLVAKLFPITIVEAVLRDFQGRGLINDGLYAETFSHSRWKSSSWGPRRIKQALSQKGVTEHDVEKAVKLVFEDSEEVEQGSSVKLSSSSLDQLYIQASKQWQRSHDAHPEKRKARVIRWLQYRGFDWGVIGTIIKKLESKHPRATLP